MKIRTLFLQAFGPFTRSVLDFSGPAGLHLIYGPNEAGKSSALRAITDLRYGIHSRSKDDFVHDFKDMRLACCFEDADGLAVGLSRRKGNKDTLTNADPATGAALAGSPAASVSPEVLLALTGGVTREQFETMYGLNSSHLRRGGQLLIQGDGELGAALFEASTGAAGIKLMLQTLQADARKYFVPRGHLPILNEAARQLDEARQRYKLAVTKPDQWKTLHRAHEDAKEQLAGVRTQLAEQRGKLETLAELRAVAPQLQALDRTQSEWDDVQHHETLPADSRERRLSALEQKAKAQEDMAQADEAMAACRQSLLSLQVEPLLIAHAPAIDRLEADCSMARREQASRLALQATTEAEAGQLGLQAARMLPAGTRLRGLEEFFSQTPSAADQTALMQTLETSQALSSELQHVHVRLHENGRKLAQLERESLDAPVPDQQDLPQQLRQAQLLGDTQKRSAELNTVLDTDQRRLGGLLRDLGLASAGQLVLTRWLAAAEIDAYERERSELLGQAVLEASAQKSLQADLVVQQRRGKALAATGEVVSADTLRQARQARDQGWQALRAAFIDLPAGDSSLFAATTPAAGLPAQFEQAQAQADRQADLLREGAQRAAEIAECEQRITDMLQTQAERQTRQAAQAGQLAVLDENWHSVLSALGLPAGTAAGVREWLALRQAALEQHERLEQNRLARSLLARQISDASAGLAAALTALGRMLPQPLPPLDVLMALGTAADRDSVATHAAMQRRHADMAALAQALETDQAQAAHLEGRLRDCQARLDQRCISLYLDSGASADTLKARLAELQRWAGDYRLHVAQCQQLRALQAGEAAAVASANALGELLREPAWTHLDAWLDALVQRLSQSREAVALQVALARNEADESKRRQRALDALVQADRTLAELVALAGLAHADALPDAEIRSDRRRAAMARLQELKDQLASTSLKSADALRQALAGLDSVAVDLEKQACASAIEQLEAEEKTAIEAEQTARIMLKQVDTSDEAAQAREEMESAMARYRAGVRPWAQLKLAEALLGEALRRHREKAQGPVVALAGDYFRLMTGGRFVRLLVDADNDTPVLLAQPAQGRAMEISALSEGTADQLYLALRLAALALQQKPDRMMPLVLDDVLMTADDERAAHMFSALEKFATRTQVLVFTHHHHLLKIASRAVGENALRLHRLENAPDNSQSGLWHE